MYELERGAVRTSCLVGMVNRGARLREDGQRTRQREGPLTRPQHVEQRVSVDELHDHEEVGAVAIDKIGRIAAGASTGGICGKPPGRMGDTPVPGAGYYADDLLAGAACTGWGNCANERARREHVGHSLCVRHGAGVVALHNRFHETRDAYCKCRRLVRVH